MLYTLIEEPVLLPGMGTGEFGSEDLFFDKSTMIKQLLIKEENCFNRSPLTIQQMEEYNKTPIIMEKINMFKDKLNKWKFDRKK